MERRDFHIRRFAGVMAATVALAGCGSTAGPTRTLTRAAAARRSARDPAATTRPKPAIPRVLPLAGAAGATSLVPAVTLRGRAVAWLARTAAGVALLSFDQRSLELHLHSGTLDAGSSGWRYGPKIAGAELHRAVAAFNGGFQFHTGAGGFRSDGRTAVPLRDGLGSVVTYADGFTDIGTWHGELPGAGHGAVVSVRQNLTPLIDHGSAAASTSCLSCWGAVLGGVADPARSALGVTADGRLVWAGGEHLTVSALAEALLGARVVRAVELDINPEWVAAYLYRQGTRRPAPVPIVPGQAGIPGQLLSPYSRDFFVVAAR